MSDGTILPDGSIVGTPDDDMLIGDENANVITGLGGDDIIDGAGGADTLIGGEGDDTLITDGLDTLFGGDVVDPLAVFGEEPPVSVDDGGIDTVDFSNLEEDAVDGAFNGVIVDLDVFTAGGTPTNGNTVAGLDGSTQFGAILDAPPAAGGAPVNGINLIDIENVIGSDFNDGLFGNNEVNVLEGGLGDDTIHGFAGNDFLSGGEGDSDTVLFAAAPAGVIVDLNDQVSSEEFAAIVAGELDPVIAASGGAGENVLEGFENVTGSQSDDEITGDGNDNTLIGLGGNDTLLGGAGDDTFISDGLDVIFGGDEVEVAIFGEDPTSVVGEDDGGIDTVDFSNLGEDAVDGAFNGVIVDLDVFTAGGTPTNGNTVAGLDGSTQFGAILDAPPAAGGAPVNGINLIDIENVIGSDFNDGLFGNNEVNVLEGGLGDDTIHGFAGNDFLSGGEGDSDTVLFAAAPAGVVVDLNDQVSASEFDDIVAGIAPAVIAASGGAGENVLEGF